MILFYHKWYGSCRAIRANGAPMLPVCEQCVSRWKYRLSLSINDYHNVQDEPYLMLHTSAHLSHSGSAPVAILLKRVVSILHGRLYGAFKPDALHCGAAWHVASFLPQFRAICRNASNHIRCEHTYLMPLASKFTDDNTVIQYRVRLHHELWTADC